MQQLSSIAAVQRRKESSQVQYAVEIHLDEGAIVG